MREDIQYQQKLLSEQIDAKQILTDRNYRESFAIGNKIPNIVIFPQNVHQAQYAIKIANRFKVKVTFAGTNKYSQVASIPSKLDWVISTARMNQIVTHDEADFSVTVQTGITLSELQHQISKKNQFLPLDPPDGNSRTIGGIVATNSMGSLSYHFGKCQDLILGMKIILPDGRIIKTGGKTVKNVAGYNLASLFIGSWGIFGLIYEITFKLLPMPHSSTSILIGFENTEKIKNAARKILKSKLIFTQMDFMNRNFYEQVLSTMNIAAKGTYFLLLNAQGVTKTVTETTNALKREISEYVSFSIIKENQRDKVWLLLIKNYYEELIQKNNLFHFQIFSTKDKMWDYIDFFQNELNESLMHGYAGNGILNIFWDRKNESDLKEKLHRAREFSNLNSGTLIAKILPDDLRMPGFIWGKAPAAISVMRSIKKRFDPREIIVTNRYFGAL